jgi:hypothetical protein
MIKDQNTIVLFSQNGYHEEYTLSPTETGFVLPGSVVSLLPTGSSNEAYVCSQAAARLTGTPTEAQRNQALDAAELLIVKENALVGGGINRPSRAGETLLLERAVTGDRYLVRAVAGTYTQGTPLYLTQTANGIYFTAVVGGAPTVRAIAIENFTITADMVDKTDQSTIDGYGINQIKNGDLVNLLRVRIA